ncbi:hypothetical protein [Kitasatospora purpeofusca]|uniref:hypothetical protein n=1 Tax=Kitasatospora purpeofusca TaxID=67352 RepID=UPI0035D8695D
MTTLTNAHVVTPHEVLEPGWVTFSGPTIAGVGTGEAPAAAADGHDVRIAFATASHRVALVTDAAPAAGTPDGGGRLEDVDITP